METIFKVISNYYSEETLNHVIGVSKKFTYRSDEWILSLLHDILEDTNISTMEIKKLLKYYNKEYLFICLNCITRKKEETYFDYINRIKNCSDGICKEVKIADLEYNLNRKETLKESLEERYNKALKILYD